MLNQALSIYRATGRFTDIYPLFPGYKKPSVRRMVYEALDRGQPVPPTVEREAKGRQAQKLEAALAWANAEMHYEEKASLEKTQKFYFREGTISITFIADLHAGSPGANLRAFRQDVSLINETPGAYIVTVGDMMDNMTVGRLVQTQMHNPITLHEQAVIAKSAVQLVAPRLLAAINGNHDNWTPRTVGLDYMTMLFQDAAPGAVVASDEMYFTAYINGFDVPFRVRHKWPGRSSLNPVHAIVKMQKDDIASPYWRVGVGAHNHTGGYVADMLTRGGLMGLAMQCGTYKDFDDYADEIGAPVSPNTRAVTVIIHDDGKIFGMSDLNAAMHYMRLVAG